MHRTRTDLRTIRRAVAEPTGEEAVVVRILERGVARGEVDGRKLSPRVVAVPADLTRNEMVLSLEPMDDQVNLDILDLVFLPLIRPDDPKR